MAARAPTLCGAVKNWLHGVRPRLFFLPGTCGQQWQQIFCGQQWAQLGPFAVAPRNGAAASQAAASQAAAASSCRQIGYGYL